METSNLAYPIQNWRIIEYHIFSGEKLINMQHDCNPFVKSLAFSEKRDKIRHSKIQLLIFEEG